MSLGLDPRLLTPLIGDVRLPAFEHATVEVTIEAQFPGWQSIEVFGPSGAGKSYLSGDNRPYWGAYDVRPPSCSALFTGTCPA